MARSPKVKLSLRFFFTIGFVLVLLVIFQLGRLNLPFYAAQFTNYPDPLEIGKGSMLGEEEKAALKQNRALVVFDSDREALDNIERVLATLKFKYDVMACYQRKPDYLVYDLVIILQMDQDRLADHDRLIQYVKQGGCLIYLGNGGEGPTDILRTDAGLFGITQIGPNRNTNAAYFNAELLTGITGLVTITGEFMTPYNYFQSVDVNLDDDCQVYLETGDGNPLIWDKVQENGKAMAMNIGNYSAKEIRGLLTGSIAKVLGLLIYPITNSEVIFIDDFPADYRSSPEILRVNYGRDLQRYILEIWWPQMLSLLHKYDLKYTSAYIESYNDQVDGPFSDTDDNQPTDTRLINDLLTHKGEISLHGYNHQPLFLNQGRMSLYGYKAWPGQAQIIAALQQSVGYFNQMFPNYHFLTYVPPSNLLDPGTLAALKLAVPSLRVISGVYYEGFDQNNERDPDYFVQDFDLDNRYGVALPRVSSGGFYTDEVRYMVSSVVTTNGIINHFIHPDDILDPSRSKGLKWEDLYLEYDKLLGNFDKSYGWLSKDTASEAAVKLKKVTSAEIYYSQTDDEITVACDNFYGSLSLIVTTDKKLAAGEGCTLQKIDSIRYLVNMKSSKISLEVE
jgi:hypothetical protein